MTKEMAKDIAIALIARSGEVFDGYAFGDVDMSEKDKDKILKEIQNQCNKMITKIEYKYNIAIGITTKRIVESIIYK